MKKISLLVFSLFVFSLLFSQEAKFGIKAGLNISELTNNESGNTNSRAGFYAGGLAHINLNSEWALQPEFVYSSQGGKYTVNHIEHQLYLNYINIPLQLQYLLNEGFLLQTGPQLGFVVSAKDKVGNVETGYVTSADFKNVDISWSFGLGYLASSGIGIEGKYNLGISNINNAGSAIMHNSVFQIGLFYLITNNSTAYRKSYTKSRYRH